LTGQKADYTKNKGFETIYYLDLIMKFIEQHGFMERKEDDVLLWEKLPNWMTDGCDSHLMLAIRAKSNKSLTTK
jgi:ATP-dependent DNA helicase RecG